MAERLSILIVEDDEILATNLAAAAEDRGCEVVGPVATVADALTALKLSLISAAVLDANLLDRDVTPVAMELIDRGIPFIIHTGIGLPPELASVFPHVSVIMKPADPDDVVGQLLAQCGLLEKSALAYRGPAVDPAGGGTARNQKIAKIASALYDQFGVKAIVLARRQYANASGEALVTWSAIIEHLDNRSNRGLS